MSTRPASVNLVDAYSSAKPGCRYNEDRVGTFIDTHWGAAWVIDGATGFQPDVRLVRESGSDAEWYADRFNGIIRSSLHEGALERDERKFFYSALREVRRDYNTNAVLPADKTERCLLPSAAGLIVTYASDTHTLKFSGLGDCVGIVKVDGHDEPFMTHPSFAEEEARRKEMKALGQYSTDDRRQLRNRMNHAGGYWILSVHPEAAGHVVHEELVLPPGRGAQALIMSDGLERSLILLNKTPAELVTMVQEHGMEQVIDRVRMREKVLGPDVMKRLGFSKQHDDISGVLFEITPD